MADRRMSLGDIAKMNTLRPEEMDDEDLMEESFDESGADSEEDGAEQADNDAALADGTDVEGAVSGGEAYMPSNMKKEPKKLEHSDPCYTVAAKPTKEDLFRFLFAHTYLNPMGVVAMLIGIAAIALVVVSAIKSSGTLQTVLLAAVALIFILNSPVSLYFKAKKQAESMENESDQICYCFSEAGFDMTKTDGYAAYDWESLFLVKEGKTAIYMYLARNQAFVLPKSDLGDNLDDFKAMIIEHVNPRKCKLIK